MAHEQFCTDEVRREEIEIEAREPARSLSDIAVRDEAKEVRPDARPQARKNRRCIRWNTLRIFSGRERRRWSRIVRRSKKVNVGQAPKEGGALPERCSSQVQKAESLPAGRSRHTRNGAGS